MATVNWKTHNMYKPNDTWQGQVYTPSKFNSKTSPYVNQNYTNNYAYDVTGAKTALNKHNANKPGEYQSNYQGNINGLIDNLSNRKKFSYNSTGDKIVLKTADGKTVDTKDVVYKDDVEAIAYETISGFEAEGRQIDADTANGLLREVKAETVPEAKLQLNAMKEAFRLGTIGTSVANSNLVSTDANGNIKTLNGIPVDILINANQYGFKQAEKYKKADEALNKQIVETAKNKHRAKKASKGKVTFKHGETLTMAHASDIQKASVKVIKGLAKALNLDIEIFISPVNNKGQRIGKNGSFNIRNGKITIDLFAGTTGKGTSLFTLSHELVHDLKIKNIKGYNRLGDFLEQQYVEKGKSVDEIVKDYQNKLGLSYNEAYEEWVADSCEAMLMSAVEGNTSVLNQLKNKCYDIWLKLREVITKFAKIISKEYSNIKPDSEAGRFVADMDKATLKLMHQMYMEEIAKAGEASQYFDGVDDMLTFMEEHNISAEGTYLEQYQNKNTATEDGVKYMLRNVPDDFSANIVEVSQMDSVIELSGNEFGKSEIDLVTQVEKFFSSFGNSVTTNYGDILLTRPGIKSSIAHGLGRVKAVAFKGVPTVLKQGKIIDYKNNWKNRGYDTAVFAAPITISDTVYYMAVVVRAKLDSNDYYLHEVVLQEKEDNDVFKTGTAKSGAPSTPSSSVFSLLQKLNKSNSNSEKSDIKKSERDATYLEAVNSGDVISLSERFNEQNEDIRYSTRDYSYESLINKPDMKVTIINDNISYDVNSQTRKNIVNQSLINVSSVGKVGENGTRTVFVKDIDKNIIVSRNSIEHGLDRRLKISAPVLLNIGSILENSIIINELTPKQASAVGSYVLIGYAQGTENNYIVRSIVNQYTGELDNVDVLYAINTKKETAGKMPGSHGDTALPTVSTISISDLLDLVNKYFPDILPEDVLKHYGYEERPNGDLGDNILYQTRPDIDDILFDDLDEDMTDTDAYLMGQYLSNDVETVTHLVNRTKNIEISDTKLNQVVSRLTKSYGLSDVHNKELAVAAMSLLESESQTDVKEGMELLNNTFEQAVKESTFPTDDETALRNDILDYLLEYRKTHSVYLSDEQISSLEFQGRNVNWLKKKLFGTVNIVNENTVTKNKKSSFADFYESLAQEFPQTFSMEDIDKVETWDIFVEKLDDVKNPKGMNTKEAFDKTESEFSKELTGRLIADIVENKYNSRKNAYVETLVKKLRNSHNTKVKKAKLETRKKVKEAERKRYEKKLDSIVEKNKEQKVKAIERRSKTETRHKIRKLADTFKKRLLSPTKGKYVPRPLISQTIDVLNLINLDTGRSVRLSKEIAALRNTYDAIKKDQQYFAAHDEVVSNMMNDLSTALGDTAIMDMSLEQLQFTYDTLRALDTVIRNSVEMVDTEYKQSVHEFGRQAATETKDISKSSTSWFSKYLSTQMRPETFFEMIAGFKKDSNWSKLYKMLNDGQLHQIQLEMEFASLFSDLVSQSKQSVLREIQNQGERLQRFEDEPRETVGIFKKSIINAIGAAVGSAIVFGIACLIYLTMKG